MFCEFPVAGSTVVTDPCPDARDEAASKGGAAPRLTYVLDFDAIHQSRVDALIADIPGAIFCPIRSGMLPTNGPRVSQLPERLEQVLRLLGKGMSNKVIGRMLGISHLTVRNHVARLLQLYGVTNRGALLQLVERQGWI